MKKSLLLSLLLLAPAAPVLAEDFTAPLVVTINEESTDPQPANISLSDNGDGTYDLSLKNFCLAAGSDVMPVGNINIAGVPGEKSPLGVISYQTKRTIQIAPGDQEGVDMWLGPMLGDVPVDFQAYTYEGQIYCTIDIDMMSSLQQVIKVKLGKPFPEIEEKDALSVERFQAPLVVTINEESTEPQPANISLYRLQDGTYDLSLQNFCLAAGSDVMPVGNINIKGVPATENELGVTAYQTNRTIQIAEGDMEGVDMWLGPMLGDVPVDFQAYTCKGQIYCTIDIDMMSSLQQVIKVKLGAPYIVAPELLDLGEVEQSDTQSSTYWFNAQGVGCQERLQVDVDCPGLSLGTADLVEGQTSASLVFAPTEVGPVQGTLTLSTPDGGATLSVPVQGTVVAPDAIHAATTATRSQKAYDLSGRAAARNARGLLIVGGRKVVR